MNSFSNIIGWHPGFHIVSPASDQLILAGETESFLLQGEQFHDLFLYVDGTRSILDIISQASGLGKQAMLLNTIEDLIEKSLIVKKNGQENSPVYYRPDFDLEPVLLRCHSDLLELRILSEFGEPDFWVQWAEQLNIEKPTGVVIADDYLDPRLIVINRIYMQEKRPWLLIKPTGKRPLVGPCFTPENRNTPCMECLSYRLIHNQPVRRWLQNMEKNGTIRIPVGYQKETIKKVMAVALKPAHEFIDRQISFFLQSVATDNLSFTDHPVSFLPQCPCCGEPGMSIKKNPNPIILNPCPKIHITDGGVRSVSPLKTIEKLRLSLSPITGIIGDLSLLPGQDQNVVPIYRSFFFKVPGFRHKPESNDFMQISLGKGISEEQSKASALCESVERHAVQYRGDEPQVLSPAWATDFQAVLPHDLAGFSEKQYRQFYDPQHPTSKASYAVRKYHSDIPLTWTPAWSLSDEKSYYVPLAYCYANTPFENECFSRFNSNGCAAGNTLEEALLQGFLELVERDATAIWWYNKIPRPTVSFDMLTDENIRLIRQTLAMEWDYWALDITHDFQIPVMVAVARHKKGKTYRLGFGCHINPVLACQRALTELCQLIAIKNRGPAVFDFNRIADEPFLRPKDNTPQKKKSDFIAAEHADIRNDILYCVRKATDLSLKTLAVDYTRPDIPIHTARVIVPGLCHIWPQFGNTRLTTVPVAMGWNKTELTEDQLNPLPLLI